MRLLQWQSFPFKQGPQKRLRQAAGASAPSGGMELHEMNDRGGGNCLVLPFSQRIKLELAAFVP